STSSGDVMVEELLGDFHQAGRLGVDVAQVDCFFFQAEDGIRDRTVTGVQTCALPIFGNPRPLSQVKLGGKLHTAVEALEREMIRSEERRVGKECRSRWAREHEKKKKNKDGSAMR